MRQQGFVQRALILVLIISLFGTAGYFTFRRTLLADIQEAIINPDVTDTLAYGATLFQTRGCSSCHTLQSANAFGDEGPDLSRIGSQHDAAYIRTSIVNPNAVIAEGCPEGDCQANVMPQFGSILNDSQIDALVTYLSEQK